MNEAVVIWSYGRITRVLMFAAAPLAAAGAVLRWGTIGVAISPFLIWFLVWLARGRIVVDRTGITVHGDATRSTRYDWSQIEAFGTDDLDLVMFVRGQRTGVVLMPVRSLRPTRVGRRRTIEKTHVDILEFAPPGWPTDSPSSVAAVVLAIDAIESGRCCGSTSRTDESSRMGTGRDRPASPRAPWRYRRADRHV